MLLIPCELRPSKIHGIGLFTLVAIPAWTVVWRFVPPFDQLIPEAVMMALGGPAGEWLRSIAYRSRRNPGMWVQCGDLMGMENHSTNPNCEDFDEGLAEWSTRARCDIGAGEELTGDYREFDASWEEKFKPDSRNYGLPQTGHTDAGGRRLALPKACRQG